MFVDTSEVYIYPEHPTLRNVNRRFFNCGGYALGILKWYWPVADIEQRDELYYLMENESYEEARELMEEQILKEFPELQVVPASTVFFRRFDVKKYEIIAFRVSYCYENWDFHFKKLGKNFNWYEKHGSSHFIERSNFESVFASDWDGRYDSPITFFMRPRK